MPSLVTIRSHLFQLSFAILMAHELDAVRRREWEVLPLTRYLPDPFDFGVFVLAHIPLVWLITALAWGTDARARKLTRSIFCAFCVVHVGLHWLYRADPAYDFNNPFSMAVIGAAGSAGLAYFVAAVFERAKPS